MQRRDALAILQIDLGARSYEQIHGFQIIVVYRPVQRGRPVGLGHIDVGFPLKQRAKRRCIALHHSICDVRPARAERYGAHRKQEYESD